MVTCADGHENPRGQHFCGECGASLVARPSHPSGKREHTQSRQNRPRVAQSRVEPPRTNANELRPGGSVKVVAPGDDHDGQIGMIYELLDDDSGVCVKFSGDSEPYAFGRDELKAVPTPRHKPTVSKASAQPK